METLGLFQTWLSRQENRILDVLYPPACIECGVGGFWCCDSCFESIDFDIETPMVDGIDCVHVIGSYANPVLRKLLTSYKYRSASCLRPILRLLVERWKREVGVSIDGDWTILTTPTDEQHILERGYDHTVYLAEIVRDLLLPHARIVSAFHRNRKTEANASLHESELRIGNIKGSIELIEPVHGLVFLIDDVLTSGATMGECARVLRRSGVERIEGLAFALGR